MRIVSLFSGCGGLDLGFANAGFEIVWANDCDRSVWGTFESNFPGVLLDRRGIGSIPSAEIPDAEGIIGGPPCQSWSVFGANRGMDDERGRIFLEYVRVIRDKQPTFFVAENVAGILAERHAAALDRILGEFYDAGYMTAVRLFNAADFGVPQDRERVLLVGYRDDLHAYFGCPGACVTRSTLRDAIWDLREFALPAMQPGNAANASHLLAVPNHEWFEGGWSPHFMSRNRVRGWHERSFTVQAGARHAPLHPQAFPMVRIGRDRFEFDAGSPAPYRRMTVRECARVQTFPDNFIFSYGKVTEGYKMVGNAVPPAFAERVARHIAGELSMRLGV
jgi:DNA (cytosine-5)-methyltransferase 1